MIQKINITFGFLIAAVISAYLFAEIGIKHGSIFIALFSVIKFLLVGFIFMSVIQSHVIWKISLVVFCLLYFGTVLVFY